MLLVIVLALGQSYGVDNAVQVGPVLTTTNDTNVVVSPVVWIFNLPDTGEVYTGDFEGVAPAVQSMTDSFVTSLYSLVTGNFRLYSKNYNQINRYNLRGVAVRLKYPILESVGGDAALA
jgi:hypothetical protein